MECGKGGNGVEGDGRVKLWEWEAEGDVAEGRMESGSGLGSEGSARGAVWECK